MGVARRRRRRRRKKEMWPSPLGPLQLLAPCQQRLLWMTMRTLPLLRILWGVAAMGLQLRSSASSRPASPLNPRACGLGRRRWSAWGRGGEWAGNRTSRVRPLGIRAKHIRVVTHQEDVRQQIPLHKARLAANVAPLFSIDGDLRAVSATIARKRGQGTVVIPAQSRTGG